MSRVRVVKPLRPFYIVKVTGKGVVKTIYIPADIQREFGIEVGDYAKIDIDAKNRRLIVTFLKPEELKIE